MERDVRVIGEATPDCLYWPRAFDRIRAYNPAMKIIVRLRHPVDRAYSPWPVAVAGKRSTSKASWTMTSHNAPTADPYDRVQKACDACGLCTCQLKHLFAAFLCEQVAVIKSEAFRQDARPHLLSLCDFLGIRRAAPAGQPSTHEGRYDQPMAATTRKRLLAFYGDGVDALEVMLNWGCADWRVWIRRVSRPGSRPSGRESRTEGGRR